MPTIVGYVSSGLVGIVDVGASYVDETVKVKKDGTEVPLGDQTLNALNSERIIGVIGTGAASWMMRNKPDSALKKGIEIAHYCYVPLTIRSIVNIIRKEVLKPSKEAYHGREYGQFETGQYQTISTPEGQILSPFS